MHFPTLIAESDLPTTLGTLIAELMARKAETRELGHAPLPKAIADLLDVEFLTARETLPSSVKSISFEARIEAETFFRQTIARWHK